MARDIDAALGRLQAAMGALDAAVARHLDVDGRTRDLETELAVMGEDRARLATELDAASARLARLGGATEAVERRVGAAIEAIRDALGEGGGEAEPFPPDEGA